MGSSWATSLLSLVLLNLLLASSKGSSSYVMARILPESTLLENSYLEDNGGAGGGGGSPGGALPPYEEQDSPATFVLSKKSATALNKLMIALRGFENHSAEKGSGFDYGEPGRLSPILDTFNLQRRNQKDRKTYLRCYFNAVSCF